MKDLEGREWTFRVTARTVRDIQTETGLDPRAISGEKSLIQAIKQDSSILLRVLWITIRAIAEARGVTEDQWLEAHDDECIEAASTEWTKALIDFFPTARRSVMSRAMAKVEEKIKQASNELNEAIESGAVDYQIDEALKKHFHHLTETQTDRQVTAAIATKVQKKRNAIASSPTA